MDPDAIVPPQFKVKLAQLMAAQQQPPPGAPMPGPAPGGSPPAPVQNGQMLQNGAPIADNFAPQKAACRRLSPRL